MFLGLAAGSPLGRRHWENFYLVWSLSLILGENLCNLAFTHILEVQENDRARVLGQCHECGLVGGVTLTCAPPRRALE